MKKFLFILAVTLVSIALLGIVYGQKQQQPVSDVVDELIFPKDSTYFLSGGRLLDSSVDSRILARRLQDGDVVMYLSWSEEPELHLGSYTDELRLGRWLYLISAFDAYRNYEVFHSDFHLKHMSNGVYFVDTRSENRRIFSMTALLQLWFASTGSTQVEIFPSEYISYSPDITDKLLQADVFRIGQLSDFWIADPHTGKGFELIFWSDADESKILFDEYAKYYMKRQDEVQRIIARFSPQKTKGLGALEDFGLLFVNDSKKKIILENSLVALLQTMVLIDSWRCDFCKEEWLDQKSVSGRIQERLNALGNIDSQSHAAAKSLVRKYLTFWSSVTALHSAEYYGVGWSILTAVYESSFPDESRARNTKIYKLLSDIYSQYFFGAKDEGDLQKNLASYIAFLVNSQSMGEREFLGFTYFLKEFLNSKGNSEDSNIRLFSQMVSIAEKYIESLSDVREKTGMLSTFYYTFNSISNRMEQGVQSRFFDGTTDNLVLKPEFLRSNRANVPAETVSSLEYLIQVQKLFLSQHQAIYMDSLWGTVGGDSTNYFTLFADSTARLEKILSIFKNYEEYRTQMRLSDASKWATGLVVRNVDMSKEKVSDYLSKFKGVEVATLNITNDFLSDGFYRIAVSIFWRSFQFKLIPDWNKIEGIVFSGADGVENRDFSQMSLSLDDRAKRLKEASAIATTPEERERYDIYNFFKSTFFPSDLPVEITATGSQSPGGQYPPLSPEMQIFVQRELIEKDFSITSKFFPISIKNIHAAIVDGNYEISLFGIHTTVMSPTRIYGLDFESKYIFTSDTHAFYELNAIVSNSEWKPYFWGQRVTMAPSTINTVDWEWQFKKLAPLLDIALKHSTEGSAAPIQLDLVSNSVIISGITYTE